jgi:hypothetical protein
MKATGIFSVEPLVRAAPSALPAAISPACRGQRFVVERKRQQATGQAVLCGGILHTYSDN